MDEFQFVQSRRMPVLPIRGISVFPGTMLTFDVERAASKAALHMAMNRDQIIFLTAQKDAAVEEPKEKDMYHVGTVCKIKQILRTPGSKTSRVLVDGLARGDHEPLDQTDSMLFGRGYAGTGCGGRKPRAGGISAG